MKAVKDSGLHNRARDCRRAFESTCSRHHISLYILHALFHRFSITTCSQLEIRRLRGVSLNPAVVMGRALRLYLRSRYPRSVACVSDALTCMLQLVHGRSQSVTLFVHYFHHEGTRRKQLGASYRHPPLSGRSGATPGTQGGHCGGVQCGHELL